MSEGSWRTVVWTPQDYRQLTAHLQTLADPRYREFHAKLVPNVNNIIGVTSPLLQQLAKEIARGDWRGFLELVSDQTHEELMLGAMVLGRLKLGRDLNLTEMQQLLRDFVPRLTSWSNCDTLCAGLKFTYKHQDEMWPFLKAYLDGELEFPVRFAIVMLMDYYIDDEHIEELLYLLEQVEHPGYYVKMAVAWAVSICFVKQRAQTLAFLDHNRLDDFTYNKALQKIVESQRVTAADKALMKKMKRK